MVVAYHYIGIGDPWTAPAPHGFPLPIYWASEYGFLGVELFFLISGFVICMSSIGRGVGDFFIARVVRLYPAYWFAVLATTLVVTLLPAVRKPLGPRDTLANLSMLQIPLHIHDVDGVYWTLWAELRFYLLFAVVVGLGVTYRRVVAFCALWTVAAIITIDHGGALMHMLFLPYQAPYFIAGTAFFLIYRYGQDAMLWGIIGLQFLLAVHYLGVDGRIRHKFGHVPAWFAVVVIAVFFVLLALIAVGALRVGWRALTTAGTLTYPIYLLHQHIGWAVLNRVQGSAPAPLLVLALTALMIALAYAVHRLVERPLARAMKTVLRSAIGRESVGAARPTAAVAPPPPTAGQRGTASPATRSMPEPAAPMPAGERASAYAAGRAYATRIRYEPELTSAYDASTYERATLTKASE